MTKRTAAPRPLASADVKAELERLLSSTDFRASQRLRRFLRFVVHETLAGRADRLKGYTIAVEVFGRPESFNSQIDPIVSVEAGRLRRALEYYYLTDGRNDALKIEIPKGTYIPKFIMNHTPPNREQVDPSCSPGEMVVSAAGISGRPAIAVLPFVYRGDDSGAAYLADGITEELIVGLSRFQGISVIAHQSSLHYKDRRSTPNQVAKELCVRFVLSGSIRERDNEVRVTVEFIDAVDSSLLWAETFQEDMTAAGLFEIQDEITRRIVVTLGDDYGVVTRRLLEETHGRRPQDLEAYEVTLLYHHYNTTFSQEAHARALQAVERAVEIDPQYALGWAQLVCLYGDVYALGYEGPEDALERALNCARRAMALDPHCQEVRSAMAFIRLLNREHATAVREAEAAIALNPNCAHLVCLSGFYIGLSGELDRGRQIIDEVEKLNPYLPGYLRAVAFVDHLIKGEYNEALREARRFRAPDNPWDPLMRAAAAGNLGDDRVAAAAYRELAKRFPAVDREPAETIRKLFHFDHWMDAMLEGLEKAKHAATSNSHHPS